MTINIENLSKQELIDLNHRIIKQLKFLELQRVNGEMAKYSIGDKVMFHPSDLESKTGVLVKYNKKTVTVITDDGEHWNVSPNCLFKVDKGALREVTFNNQNLN